MPIAVTVALITGAISLVVAVVTNRSSRQAMACQALQQKELAALQGSQQTDLARLQAHLTEMQSSRNARQDYEYEARKRLYQQCEPILFQARELAELARTRIISLARSCRSGDLRPDGGGWLDRHEYYFQSTAYYLLAPMTMFQTLRSRITSVDLSLDPKLHIQYELLKLVFFSFSADFKLANCQPTLEYDPDNADPGKLERDRLLAEAPAIYRRQGLYLGTQEVVLEALTTHDKHEDEFLLGLKPFGEFARGFSAADLELNDVIAVLDELFKGFHPQTCPVLWRILITQYLLYGAIVQGKWADKVVDLASLKIAPAEYEVDQLKCSATGSDQSVLGDQVPFAVAREYLTTEFALIDRRLSSAE